MDKKRIYLAGYAERLGTGTADIIKQCLTIGLKPPTFAQTEHFRITFWRNLETLDENPATLKPLQGLPKRMTRETLEKIILMLCSNEYLTVNQISKLTGRSSEYLLNEIMPSLLANEKLVRLFPATPKHKSQAYKTNHDNEG
jgi:predicted HTH transcriptional regulator